MILVPAHPPSSFIPGSSCRNYRSDHVQAPPAICPPGLLLIPVIGTAEPAILVAFQAPLGRDLVRKAETYRQKWALIVGINYRAEDRAGLKLGDIQELENAEKDAKAVAAILKEKYGYGEDEVKLLIGSEATLKNMQDQLLEYLDPKKVTSEDSLLIYFAGHGSQVETGVKPEGYLLPCDVKMDKKSPDVGNDIKPLAISLTHLKKALLDKCPARHRLMILDCCYSGSVFLMAEGSGGRQLRESSQ